jgi:hypothetical protein
MGLNFLGHFRHGSFPMEPTAANRSCGPIFFARADLRIRVACCQRRLLTGIDLETS